MKNSEMLAELEKLHTILHQYTRVVSSVNDPADFSPKIADQGYHAREGIEIIRTLRAAIEQRLSESNYAGDVPTVERAARESHVSPENPVSPVPLLMPALHHVQSDGSLDRAQIAEALQAALDYVLHVSDTKAMKDSGITQVKAGVACCGEKEGPYTLRRDDFGYAAAIERDGYTVLQLVAGAKRNEEQISGLLETLNKNTTHRKEVPSAEEVERVATAITWNIAGQMKAVVTPKGYTAFGEHNLDCEKVAKAAIAAMNPPPLRQGSEGQAAPLPEEVSEVLQRLNITHGDIVNLLKGESIGLKLDIFREAADLIKRLAANQVSTDCISSEPAAILHEAISLIANGKYELAQRRIVTAMHVPIPELVATKDALSRCQEELKHLAARGEVGEEMSEEDIRVIVKEVLNVIAARGLWEDKSEAIAKALRQRAEIRERRKSCISH